MTNHFISSDHKRKLKIWSPETPWLNLIDNPVTPRDRDHWFTSEPLIPLVTDREGIFAMTVDEDTTSTTLDEVACHQSLDDLLERSWNLALAHTTLVRPKRIHAALRPKAFQVYRICKGADDLRGESFGLSMTLAYVQWLSGVPLGDDLVCSAAIDREGRLTRVEGLQSKIEAVRQFRGLKRFAVCEAQVSEAQKILIDLDLTQQIEIVGWACLQDALQDVFTEDQRHNWGTQITRQLERHTLRFERLQDDLIHNHYGAVNRQALRALIGEIQSHYQPTPSTLMFLKHVFDRHWS